MPFCETYEKLDPHDKAVFIGELAHVAMFDEESYQKAAELINQARNKGILDMVKFGAEVYSIGEKNDG